MNSRTASCAVSRSATPKIIRNNPRFPHRLQMKKAGQAVGILHPAKAGLITEYSLKYLSAPSNYFGIIRVFKSISETLFQTYYKSSIPRGASKPTVNEPYF
jgi:hypothetical protein